MAEHLGGFHHRAPREVHWKRCYQPAVEELEGAVDIADFQPENGAVQYVPALGIDQAHEWVFARSAIAEDDRMLGDVFDELRELIQPELEGRRQ